MSDHQFTYRSVVVPAGLPGCGTSFTVEVPEERIAVSGGSQLEKHEGTAAQIQVFDGPVPGYPRQWYFQVDACGTIIHTPDRMVYLRLYVDSVPE